MGKTKYYSKNKCKCIANKEIFGMGHPNDEHYICHNCGCLSFPCERLDKYCISCKTNPYMLSNEPWDRMEKWNYPNRDKFEKLINKEEKERIKQWHINLTWIDKIKIRFGRKCVNNYVKFSLDELRRGCK